MDNTVSTLKKTSIHGGESEHWNESQMPDRLNKSSGEVLALLDDQGGMTLDPRKRITAKTNKHSSTFKNVKSINSSLIKDYSDSPPNPKKSLARTQKGNHGINGKTVS